jgi:choice-of-anchor B domain-containing protein
MYLSTMKLFKLLLVCFALQNVANAQDSWRLRLQGHWNNPNLAVNPHMPGQLWNELTGYVDSASQKEYIIMGSNDSVYFFDITDPTQIRLCDVEFGTNRDAINRDVETYSHFAYCVSDNAPHGNLQIFDLQYLPDSVHKVYEDDTLGANTHSIFIDKAAKRLYMCVNKYRSGKVNGLEILSLEKPDSPVYMGKLNEELFGSVSCKHVHEIYVRKDTAYCSCEYNGLFVIDFKDVANQKPLGSITTPYPYNGYNHTCWIDSSGQYIAFTDEVPRGLPAKIYQIRDLSDMTYLTHFNTHVGATPHNVFWLGNKLYFSWYQDGVYIYTVDTPRYPRLYAYYDTYHQNEPGVYDNYRGCWGVYPFLPSGNIAASDMTNGLFILKYDVLAGMEPGLTPFAQLSVSPNPFLQSFRVRFIAKQSEKTGLQVKDIQGRILYQQTMDTQAGENDSEINGLAELKSGIYFVVLRNESGFQTMKIVKE